MPTIEINPDETELKILEYSAQGLKAREIAPLLNVSLREVEDTLKRLRIQFGALNKVQLVLSAYKSGVIPD